MSDTQTDPFNLRRFLEAQDAPCFAGATFSTYDGALAELKTGAKTGHWIWFILPQLSGLGQSYRSEFYGLSGVAEAAAFHAHPTLGARLAACVDAMLSHEDKSAADILGALDATKFKSSMTLFARAAPHDARFRQALAQFFWGEEDQQTMEKIVAR